MAEIFNIDNNPFDASADNKLIIPLNSDFYCLQIVYSDFVPGAGTAFKLHRTAGTNPIEEEFVEITDSEIIVPDSDGNLIYENQSPEKADFLMLEFTADGNTGSYKVILSTRS